MKHLCELAFWLALFFSIVITIGEPDILDGWIKRANAVTCVE